MLKRNDWKSTVEFVEKLPPPPKGVTSVHGPGRARLLAEIYAAMHASRGLLVVDSPHKAGMFLDDEISTGRTYRKLKRAFPDTPFYCLVANLKRAWRFPKRDEKGTLVRDERGRLVMEPIVFSEKDAAAVIDPPKREFFPLLKSASRDARGDVIFEKVENARKGKNEAS